MRMSSIIKLPPISRVAAHVGAIPCAHRMTTNRLRCIPEGRLTAYTLLGILHMSGIIDHGLSI